MPPAAGARLRSLPKRCWEPRAGPSPGIASGGKGEVRGKGRGIEDFVWGSDQPVLPGGLKLILEKGILLVFRTLN